jgi:hypothetical protein
MGAISEQFRSFQSRFRTFRPVIDTTALRMTGQVEGGDEKQD